jgi:N-acylneuraminate cytidylyltransferase/CMP-N,N'-diacetyllegionaminic acid synthase
MEVVADLLVLVPARGGSKGLPGKNARVLGDLPLLGWTREAVRASCVDATCILSTDDDELAAIGRSVGLDVPFQRPAELASDTASALAVVDHALDWFARERGTTFHAVAWLQPTSPFRPPHALATAMQLLAGDDVPAVIGVKDLHRSPSVLYHADAAMRLTPLSDDPQQIRRQDVRPLVTPNGALYVTKVETIRQARSLYPARTIGIAMDQIESIDIDDATDWALAEAVVRAGLDWRARE